MSALRLKLDGTLTLPQGRSMEVEIAISYVPSAKGINLIDTVITAFTPEGLQHLKTFAEEFESGKKSA